MARNWLTIVVLTNSVYVALGDAVSNMHVDIFLIVHVGKYTA